ncbi:hypothetical protein FOYG_17001 [Fusarium oxysporum NRRL 32931]|uniref:Extracellular membrane protein CFEM domain-containing protein n=1 Tax=Fusarium oxysporum NRRL 32931 TaxID=660029 RepID=W9HFQ7_FUSOX|nr:hypothetical protein FOYG_17001 [Fusarium oxysporum NRRL 32931]
MFVFDKIAVILILGQNGASTPTKRSNDNCTTICAPISELASDCGYRNSTDMMGAHGEAMMQCICKNTSFNVSLITPLCASCVQENGSGGMCMQGPGINGMMSACHFASSSYTPAATSLVVGVKVSASPLITTSSLAAAATTESQNVANVRRLGLHVPIAVAAAVAILG